MEKKARTRTLTIRLRPEVIEAYQVGGKGGYTARMSKALEDYARAGGLAGLIAEKLEERSREREQEGGGRVAPF